MNPQPSYSSVPWIVRIGGLPASAMAELTTDLCAEVIAQERLELALEERRTALVECLHASVHGCESRDLRRFLLAVKRDGFNRRPLAARREDPRWAQLRALVGMAGDGLVELELAVEESQKRFSHRYFLEEERQCRWVARQFEEPGLRRGLALASLDLYNSKRIGGDSASLSRSRRERNGVLALLRYVSRAALKLSPFSAFTRLALAETCSDGECLTLRSSPWRERSLLRLKRYVLDQVNQMLKRYPPIRMRLRLTLNDSLAEIGDGRFIFLRPGRWTLDERRGSLRYDLDSLVKANLAGPTFSAVRQILAAGPLSYEDVVGRLTQTRGEEVDGDHLKHHLDRFLDLGVIHLLWPWPDDEGHLERRMLRDFQALDHDPRLQAFVGALERLVELEEGYQDAKDPGLSLAEIGRLVDELWQEAALLGGLPPEAGRSDPTRFRLHEDVFLTAAAASTASEHDVIEAGAFPAIANLPATSARRAITDVEPFVRLSALYDHRNDFRRTLAAFMVERGLSRRPISLLELFDASRSLWRDYWRFHTQTRNAGTWRTSLFNPLQLAELEELSRLRHEVWEEVAAALEDDERKGETRIHADVLTAALDRMPKRYMESAGACLLLQPADKVTGLWVLNRLKEGTGRYGSRYTSIMDAATERSYARHLQERAWLECCGERLELVEILCTQGDNLNVHSPLTPRLLALPGSMGSVAAERHLRLGDLRVKLDAEGWPVLIEATGRRLLPVHLGLAFSDFMPTLFRFLGLFGPSELSAVFPQPRIFSQDGLWIRYRLRIGDVVLRRRAWSVPARQWVQAIAGLGGGEAFRALNRLRERNGIPERVFCNESVVSPVRGTRKLRPQYLDFTSPLFVQLFRAVMESHEEEYLDLMEMLPSPDDFPQDGNGERWALELVADEAALRPAQSSAQDSGDVRSGVCRAASVELGTCIDSDQQSPRAKDSRYDGGSPDSP